MAKIASEDLQDGLDLLREGPYVREALFKMIDTQMKKQAEAILNSVVRVDKQQELILMHAEYAGMQKLVQHIHNEIKEKRK